ncbi:hypothetical protein [Streptomyces milbemycinicus]|uniref:Uncharacterized protein n=1 Tax=Streptomyces milbemycinicus TaxID=476552 RepID=A0ABW8LTP4_9ACTN
MNTVQGSEARILDAKSLDEMLSGATLEIRAGREQYFRDSPTAAAAAAQHQAVLIVQKEQEGAAVHV